MSDKHIGQSPPNAVDVPKQAPTRQFEFIPRAVRRHPKKPRKRAFVAEIKTNRQQKVSITKRDTQITPGLQGIASQRHIADVAGHFFQAHIVHAIHP